MNWKSMKEEVRAKTKKKIATELEETLIERGRQEACESFLKLVEKKQYRGLDSEHRNIIAVFPALLLTIKIVLKIRIIIVLKNYVRYKKRYHF